MENLYKKTKDIMRKYNISANKSLGQNFLINEDVVESIVNSSNITEKDLVIEIGPGLGTLTEYLLQKAGKVIAIELDNRMLEILNQRFYQYTNFEIINQDVLKVDLNSIINNEKNYNNFENVKIVANLPYYITTPIVMKLLEEKLDIQSITVMIQKEVAQRLIATPGDKLTGAITYCVYYYAESESIMTVPNSSFIPEPEVESQVIKLNIRKKPPVRIENEELFFRVIKTSFMQRRKTLINSLANGGLVKNKEEFKQVLNKMELDSNVRGETLTIEQFAIITQELS